MIQSKVKAIDPRPRSMTTFHPLGQKIASSRPTASFDRSSHKYSDHQVEIASREEFFGETTRR